MASDGWALNPKKKAAPDRAGLELLFFVRAHALTKVTIQD